MPDLLIRDIDPQVLSALDALANAAGQTRAAWLKTALTRLAEQPLVADRYSIHGWLQLSDGALVQVNVSRRDGQGFGGITGNANSALNPGRLFGAFAQAKEYASRNAPGDKERIISTLNAAGFEVVEKAY